VVLKYSSGDLLRSAAQIIVHQVNCRSAMGSGVAGQIRSKWPEVYDSYRKVCSDFRNRARNLLGVIDLVQVSETQQVCNLFGQALYGYDSQRYTNYEAVYTGLECLRDFMVKEGKTTVAFPYKMSCDRGGADWDVILTMIKSVFGRTGIEVEIVEYESGLTENRALL